MKQSLVIAMNARIIGSGQETIVMAHGYGADQSVWDKILPHFTARFQVLLFDWCFSGAVKDPNLYDSLKYSSFDDYAEDLICLVDEMKVKGSVFVGHSMSCMIGCIASIKRPDLFRRLVLVTPSPRFINMEGYKGGFERSDVEHLFSRMESNYEEWTGEFASTVVDPIDPLSVQKFHNCLRSMRPEVALAVAKTVFLSDHRHVLEQVVLPCHIIRARSDVVVPDSVPKYMQNKIKGECELDVMDTIGHFPQLTAHVEFIRVLDRILAY